MFKSVFNRIGIKNDTKGILQSLNAGKVEVIDSTQFYCNQVVKIEVLLSLISEYASWNSVNIILLFDEFYDYRFLSKTKTQRLRYLFSSVLADKFESKVFTLSDLTSGYRGSVKREYLIKHDRSISARPVLSSIFLQVASDLVNLDIHYKTGLKLCYLQ